MNDIQIIRTKYDKNGWDLCWVLRPNIDLAHNSIYRVLPHSLLQDPYFSIHSVARKQFLFQIVTKRYNKLMKSHICFETELYPSDSDDDDVSDS